MDKIYMAKIKEVIKVFPSIKLAYFFGSQIKKETGLLSDYDFAIYLDEKDKIKMRDIQFALQFQIAKILKTDKVDIVVLNLVNNPFLKYNIVKEGKIIFERAPYRVLVEPKIMNEYFDLQTELCKYNLSKTCQ